MKTITLDYQGSAVYSTREAWFNATEIAAMFSKQLYEWLQLPETERYIEALLKRETEKQSASDKRFSRITKAHFIKTRKDHSKSFTKDIWLHPKLASAFARWCDIDFALWCDEQIETLIANGKDWHAARAESKLGFQVMAEIIKASRQASGKDTKPYHYSNEALLCNAALTGQFKPVKRNRLNKAALTMLIRLEARNAALIGQGLPYEKRKALLFEHSTGERKKFQAGIV
ncbi:MAG: KilA-N domain-containing protein [Neisseria sp.]|uniref:KilA-N domain-containing protein n=1 Tax=Neisseria sp. TaxID=192066 RepID=UPI0026DC2EBA|nr:KilA-N domain-containing protein [Neisseria sp.]MDO4642010.1 KilA-N domain-containing protein [Neisseria sp.]